MITTYEFPGSWYFAFSFWWNLFFWRHEFLFNTGFNHPGYVVVTRVPLENSRCTVSVGEDQLTFTAPEHDIVQLLELNKFQVRADSFKQGLTDMRVEDVQAGWLSFLGFGKKSDVTIRSTKEMSARIMKVIQTGIIWLMSQYQKRFTMYFERWYCL